MALSSSVRWVEHGRGVDDGVALERGLFLEAGIDPGRGQAEGRLGGVDAGHLHLAAAGVHDHELVRPDLAGAGVDLLDLDDVGVGLELHVVENAHRRHDKAHLDRERAAQRLDLLGEAVGAVGAIDERQQGIAELDLEVVDLQRGGDRLLGCGGARGSGLPGSGRGLGGFLGLDARALVVAGVPGERAGTGAECEERNGRNARQRRQHQHDRRGHRERLRIAGKLLHQRLVGGAGDAGLGDEQARRGRDDQRRHLGDEAVTDGQQRVAAAGVGEGQTLLRHADDHAADHVDEDDQEAGDGVAADEFRGAVHGAEEAALVLQLLAPLLGDLLVDQAGGEIGVDRHLLAGHGVEVEAGGDFGDTARTLGDDDEIDDDQDGEDDDADDEIAAHHEAAEGFDDVTGGIRALVPVRQDQAGRGHVERQPQHGRDQQDGRKCREFQRRLDEQRRHQDQDRERDRDRQEQVQHDRRQRQDQHHQDGEDAERQRDVAALEDSDDFVEGGGPAWRCLRPVPR